MNYVVGVELTSDVVGGEMTYTTNHGEQVNPGGHGPFVYKALGDAWVCRGGLTVRVYAINSQCEISPVNAH